MMGVTAWVPGRDVVPPVTVAKGDEVKALDDPGLPPLCRSADVDDGDALFEQPHQLLVADVDDLGVDWETRKVARYGGYGVSRRARFFATRPLRFKGSGRGPTEVDL